MVIPAFGRGGQSYSDRTRASESEDVGYLECSNEERPSDRRGELNEVDDISSPPEIQLITKPRFAIKPSFLQRYDNASLRGEATEDDRLKLELPTSEPQVVIFNSVPCCHSNNVFPFSGHP